MQRHTGSASNHILTGIIVLSIWIFITLGGELLQAETYARINDLISQQIIITLIIAVVFLFFISGYLYRWQGLGLCLPSSLIALRVLWLPLIYLVLMLSIATLQGFPESRIVLIVLCNAMLIGISEELMFRGILFKAAYTRLPPWKAIWFTSIIFGAIHALNALITGDFTAALMQSLLATSSGIWFIAIRIRTASLIPVMIIHGLWDFSVFMLANGSGSAETESLSAEFQIFLQVIFTIPLFLYGIYLLRNLDEMCIMHGDEQA